MSRASGLEVEPQPAGSQSPFTPARRSSSFVQLNTFESQHDVEGSARVNRFAASLNMVNVIVGSGIVGLSFVVKASGVVPFTIFIIVSAYLAYLTLTMLVEAAEYTQQKSYEAIGVKALGRVGLVLTSSVIILQNIGGMTSYLILIAKTAPPLLKLAGITSVSVKLIQVVVTLVICFPLCLLRDLSLLAYTSFFALCTFALIAGTTMWFWLAGDPWYTTEAITAHHMAPAEPINWTSFSLDAFSQLPTIIFAFVCHTACLPIYSQLSCPSKERMGSVCASSIATALVLYTVTGVTGYLTYQGHIMGALVRNFRHCWSMKDGDCEDKSTYISVLNGLFLMAVLLGYPSIHFPTRRAVIALVQGVDTEFSWAVHCGVAVILVGFTLTLATFIEDVSQAFSWTGVVASPLIVFVLPAFYYQRIIELENDLPVSDPRRLKAIGIILFGLIFMTIGIFVKISELAASPDEVTEVETRLAI